MANTIPMRRESDGKTADVHPDEVENYRLGGFEPAATIKEAASAAGGLADLRKQYRDKFGKNPSPRWDAETLATKLDEAGA